MNKVQTEKFLDSNSSSIEIIRDYFDKLLSKLESLKSENIKTQMWLLALIMIYYGIDLKLFSEINLGTFSISTNQEIIKLLIPLIFNYFFLQFAAINSQRGTIISNIRQIGGYIYNTKNDIFEESMYSKSFLLGIMPFSIAEEVQSKYLDKGKLKIDTILLTIPLIAIMVIPIIFPVLAIIDLLDAQWSLNWFSKIITVLTIWLFLVTIFYYVRLIIKSVADVKQDFSKTPVANVG
ncbi:hypothetical protein [Gillisia sp. Hel_I_29]|uniref:hypothetical protein n=1 Tax=Gillisia sp. Hel_I_29 TaxID=1249975 RepID=UPI000558273F|nr:hypothetical protein [Gillisia sp. Hel_I_29]